MPRNAEVIRYWRRLLHIEPSGAGLTVDESAAHRRRPRESGRETWRPAPSAGPAADANRRFSEVIRAVRKGKTVIVTSHGKPVASIVPMTADDQTVRGARDALLVRLGRQPVVDIARWSRDVLYEDRR